MTIQQTIISQIRAIDPMATFAWGAKDWAATPNGLRFKSSGIVRWKGIVNVEYNDGSDLYDLEFFRIRGGKVFMDDKVSDVFAEDLVRIIDSQVG